MFVILASKYDKSARDLVEFWRPHDVCVLTCEEISVAGWRHYLSYPEISTAVMSGKKINVEEIDGVLTRLHYVKDEELRHIAIHDRSYVAAEIMAFLVSWLSCLKCPVLNRPTPLCLLGPNWKQEQWIYAAAKIGIPVRSMHSQSSQSDIIRYAVEDDAKPVTVIVIGNHCHGVVHHEIAEQAIRLSHAAGVQMLSVHFSGYEKGSLFVGADLWFPITSDNIANAILDYLIEMNERWNNSATHKKSSRQITQEDTN